MAFNNSFTAVTGATYTAAQYNTHVRDNLTAIWVYTTAGDIAYATGATTLARLALVPGGLLTGAASAPAWLPIGSEFQVLKPISGAPNWRGMFDRCTIYKTANQSFNSGSGADITFDSEYYDDVGWHSAVSNTERITVTAAGHYIAFAAVRFVKSAGGSGSFETEALIRVNGSTQTGNRSRLNWDIDANPKEFTFGGIPFAMSANDYITLNFKQNSGGAGNITGALGETMLSLLRFG